MSEFLGHIESEFEGLFRDVWFSLKSSLTSNLNHSNQIRNDQVMAKIQTLVQNKALGTGTSGQNTYGSGTTPRNFPEKVDFLSFFHILLPKSTQ